MADKKVIIFDFDGTLADSAPIIRAIYDEVATKNGLRAMSDEDYTMLRRGSLREAKKWSGVRWWQFPLLIRNVRRLMKLESEKVALFPGIIELIRQLQAQGADLYILSRNVADTITHVLERHGLEDELPILARRKRSFGSKASVINSLVQNKNYDRGSVWMIGDEVRDIEAANKARVNSIAVAWGLQDVSILEKYKPTHVAHTVSELQQLLSDQRINKET